MAQAKRWRAEIPGDAWGVKHRGRARQGGASRRARRIAASPAAPVLKRARFAIVTRPERKMQAVVLAGGLATRMRPHTLTVPKSMLEVAGRPFVDWQIERLVASGLRDIVMCIAHLGERIRDHVGDGAQLGARVVWSEEGPALLGTGGALRVALPLLGETFLVTYGDSYLPFDYGEPLRMLEAHSDCDGVMAVFKNEGKWDPSNVVLDRQDRSEEHTSELQSLPPRRSPDLLRRAAPHARGALRLRRCDGRLQERGQVGPVERRTRPARRPRPRRRGVGPPLRERFERPRIRPHRLRRYRAAS